MSRGQRDSGFRRAFGNRLKRLIDTELKVPVAEVAAALGYQDPSTLRSAMTGRCGVDLDRLALLASWSKARGTPVNLHWLLAGEGFALVKSQPEHGENWLTPEIHQALLMVAKALPALPDQGVI